MMYVYASVMHHAGVPCWISRTEFSPHGRRVIEVHPTKDPVATSPINTLSEQSLLYKLTNVAIETDSFAVNNNAPGKERWCIKATYYKDDIELEDDTLQPPKDSKETYSGGSNTSRHFSRLDKVNLSLKSDSMGRKCEGGSSRGGSANSSSNMSKKFGLNSSLNKTTQKRSLNPNTDCWYEEELYVKGCTAVYSKGFHSMSGCGYGDGLQRRETIASFTLKSLINHAVFCNFHHSMNNVMFIDALNTQIQGTKNFIKIEDTFEASKTKIIPSVLLINKKTMTVYSKNGREYVARIPFQVKRVWPMKYGVLFEKEPTKLLQSTVSKMTYTRPNVSCNNSSFKSKTFNTTRSRQSLSASESDVTLPTCFSLTHPMDEVLPCLIKSTLHGCQFYNNGDLQIIFVSSSPSIILLYDWQLGVHSLWFVRRATRDESLKMVPKWNFTNTGRSSLSSADLACMTGSKMKSTTGGSTKKTVAAKQKANYSAKLEGLRSPQPSMRHNASTTILDTHSVAAMPLYPEICFDHIWTQESQTLRRDPLESDRDTKAFVHTDFVGHSFLCFMVRCNGVSRLQMARLQKSHSGAPSLKSNIIVGSLTTILAKDAVVLDNLKIMALIDDTGNIILQSGTSVVGKVHIGGVLAGLIDSPYVRPMSFHPFPRRSSLLPTKNTDVSMMDDSSLHVLSPVPHSKPTESGFLGIKSLRDPVHNRLTLVYDKGLMYRISLPDLTSSGLVTRCIAALKATLPKDLVMQVIVNWYGTRNAPGSQHITAEQDWQGFSNLLYTLLGYNLDKITNKPQDPAEFAEIATKKKRRSSDGSNDDWEYLLNSKVHKSFVGSLSNTLNLTKTALPEPRVIIRPKTRTRSSLEEKLGQFNANALLYPYSMHVLYALHLVYEETKLSLVLMSDLQPLSVFLFHLAKEMRMDDYTALYWRDFPTVHLFEYDYTDLQVSQSLYVKLPKPPYFKESPPQIFVYLQSLLLDLDVGHYPYLADVNNKCRDVIEILNTIQRNQAAGVQSLNVKEHVGASSTPRTRFSYSPRTFEPPEFKAVKLIYERGITQDDIDNFPPAIALFIHWICRYARADPPLGWPPECFALVGRPELAIQTKIAPPKVRNLKPLLGHEPDKDNIFTVRKETCSDLAFPQCDEENLLVKMTMQHMDTKLLRLLHPDDHRAIEAFKLLQSSFPVEVGKMQSVDIADHDFMEEQEKQLFCISTRTTALPVGRGMLTLRTFQCLPTEPLSVPKLVVSGRGPPPRSYNLELNVGSGEVPANYLAWPKFHNGVAAGLSLVPVMSKNIDFAWVMFNRPKGTGDTSEEHAGFLMALGLNGYLKDMPYVEIYDYLVKTQEMVSAAILIGISATYRGTMNSQTLRLLSIHLEPLLPPTSIELNIPQITVAAALFGLGLVFEGSGHNHFTHVLLAEIGKPPTSDTQNYVDREGYALVAGLSLGFICLGKGDEVSHHVVTTLRTFMLGANRPCGILKERSKYLSCTSSDSTSPGATVALGLIFLRSGNKTVAKWMDPPDTAYLIEAVRPDLMMLRVIVKGLIMWDEVEPEQEWIEAHVPSIINWNCLITPTQDSIDYEAINQAYCNIVAGACFVLGLRFAGSGNEDAKNVLLRYVQMFVTLTRKSIGVLVGRATLETCICVSLVAAGMVMAGTGDLDVLRWCRGLRNRIPTRPQQPRKQFLTYGGQMAVHTALGLLFLGGCRFTLGTSPTAIAAMLTAFFPKFPIHTEDNRYHLQAFRHMYVLAVEMRLVIPRDLDKGALCYANLTVIDLDGCERNMRAPCLIPDLERLKEIRVNDQLYWPQVFQRDTNWNQLRTLLDNDLCVDIKQRVNKPTYTEDEYGKMTILNETLIMDNSNAWAMDARNLNLFTNDFRVKNFIRRFLVRARPHETFSQCQDCYLNDKLKDERTQWTNRKCSCRKARGHDREFLSRLNVATYFCIIKDSWSAISSWLAFLEILRTANSNPSSYNIWQIKLLNAKIEAHHVRLAEEMNTDDDLFSDPDEKELLIPHEFALAFDQNVSTVFDSHEESLTPLFRRYIGLVTSKRVNNCSPFNKKLLSAYSTYYDTPKYVFANRLLAIGKNISIFDDYMDRLGLNIVAMNKVGPLL